VGLGVGVKGTPGPGKRRGPSPARHWKKAAIDSNVNTTINMISVNRRTVSA
jgi:hypothetical protein